jgi:hypothetical protein
MKKILVILDGIVAKKLLDRMLNANINDNIYDIIYTDDSILPKITSPRFTFYKFDATSYSKLSLLISPTLYREILVVLNSKDETLNTIENIRLIKTKVNIIIYDKWDLDLNDPNIQYHRAVEILSNGLFEKLPNVPVVAQNIGMRQGELMEIKIPFGSSYAYRYIGSIKQKDWKIFGLYRNGHMLIVRPSVILKPNDIILVIGKPKILSNIYNIISKSSGQFPMPFGKNIYLYLDLLIQDQEEIMMLTSNALVLNRKLKDTKLIIKITNPSTSQIIRQIKNFIKEGDLCIIDIDYNKTNFDHIMNTDKNKYEIGLLVFGNSLLHHQDIIKQIINLKLPIFKIGKKPLEDIKDILVIPNDKNSYEQIGSILFDIASQLKIKIKLYDMDPLKDTTNNNILDELENLASIFNQKINIIKQEKNPIRQILKEGNILQVLPLKEAMFDKRYFRFTSLDTDLLSYDIKKFNQILIPVIESNTQNKGQNDI